MPIRRVAAGTLAAALAGGVVITGIALSSSQGIRLSAGAAPPASTPPAAAPAASAAPATAAAPAAAATAPAMAATPTAAAAPAAAAANCTTYQLVDARGTGEPGPLGVIVGDPLFAALQKALAPATVSSFAVQYPASLAPGSASVGNANLVNHVMSQLAACPGQKFILGGYSQGANVVDNSIGVSSAGALTGAPIVAVLPAAAQAKVSSVLLFGNPIRAQGKMVTGPLAGVTFDVCAPGDPVCVAGGANVAAHLSYTANVGMAAAFAAAHP
jgi:cutinase